MKLNTSKRKRFRVSNKVKKVASNDRYRLSISRSSKNISAQIIDDMKNITLLSASSVEKDIRSGEKINKTELSKIVAEKYALSYSSRSGATYHRTKKRLHHCSTATCDRHGWWAEFSFLLRIFAARKTSTAGTEPSIRVVGCKICFNF